MAVLDKCPFDPAIEANHKVYNYINGLHCHSDLAETLTGAMKLCGDVQFFSPESYRYLTVSTQKIIFGFAIGMDTIAFRLNKKMKAIAVETGAKPFPECGDDWVYFLPFRPDWPKVDFEFWSLKAYLNVRESVGLA
jgi:hypothetical protein